MTTTTRCEWWLGFVIAAAAAMLASPRAQADWKGWHYGTGPADANWFNTANWSGGSLPVNADGVSISRADCIINNPSQTAELGVSMQLLNRTLTINTAATGVSVGEIRDSGVIDVDGGTVTMSGSAVVTKATNPGGTIRIRNGGTWSGQIWVYNGGTLQLGDATSEGFLPALAGSRFHAGGTIVGHGIMNVGASWHRMWGSVIADGFDPERTADVTLTMLSDPTFMDSENTAIDGWYARNRAKLVLGDVAITAGTQTRNLGETGSDTVIDRVNSARVTLVGSTAGGVLSYGLLAPDHGAVPVNPFWLDTNFIGLWDIGTTASGFSSANLEFRYDHVALAAQGLLPADLAVYHYTDGAWLKLNSSLLGDQRILGTGATSFSLFAVGSLSIVPEPGSLALLGLGVLAVTMRRRAKREV